VTTNLRALGSVTSKSFNGAARGVPAPLSGAETLEALAMEMGLVSVEEGKRLCRRPAAHADDGVEEVGEMGA
jgi:hypothetical protein